MSGAPRRFNLHTYILCRRDPIAKLKRTADTERDGEKGGGITALTRGESWFVVQYDGAAEPVAGVMSVFSTGSEARHTEEAVAKATPGAIDGLGGPSY